MDTWPHNQDIAEGSLQLVCMKFWWRQKPGKKWSALFAIMMHVPSGNAWQSFLPNLSWEWITFKFKLQFQFNWEARMTEVLSFWRCILMCLFLGRSWPWCLQLMSVKATKRKLSLLQWRKPTCCAYLLPMICTFIQVCLPDLFDPHLTWVSKVIQDTHLFWLMMFHGSLQLLRERLRICYLEEGVNHYKNCREAVENYLNSIKGIGISVANAGKNDLGRAEVTAQKIEGWVILV